ncbi:MAG TPA: LysR substrate-binding domain-containing protein [Caulobacteraceae bacterium]|nr:LysR substrate-binding domain-containing protein [Caulobacteraceae bacterium]
MSQQVSLRAVETFVAVARALSLTVAAGELGLTTSAVSRRISDLEQALGVDLFRRLNRRIELTAAGVRYLQAVGEAIDRIHAGSAAIGGGRARKVVRLSALADLASSWLMPRLARFHDERPDIEVELHALADLGDVAIGEAHAALRLGAGAWPGMVSERLLDIEVAPVCAPALRPKRAPVTAEALDRFTVLSMSPALGLWDEWFDAVGLGGYRPRRVQTFDSVQVLYAAAAAGMGLALGGSFLVERELEAGRLTTAFDAAPVRVTSGWHLVYRPRDRDWPPLRALGRALHDEPPAARLAQTV